jgi:hypothetical protein
VLDALKDEHGKILAIMDGFDKPMRLVTALSRCWACRRGCAAVSVDHNQDQLRRISFPARYSGQICDRRPAIVRRGRTRSWALSSP